MQTATEPIHLSVVEIHEIGEVRKNSATNQLSFFSNRKINAGETIISFDAREVLSSPTYLTVQLSDTKHILLDPAHLQFINHSCDPNCFFDTTSLRVVALRNIYAGEEMTFFYPATEWEMSQPFVCNCKTAQCLKNIRGGKHLSEEEANRHHLNEYILAKRKANL
mgnify:CR=1 FL=1